MEYRTFLDALDAQKDAQDFLLATVLEGQQQGTALLLCDEQVAWTSAPETLLTQNLSALKKCTTSGVFTLGDTRVFAERFGAGARLVICGGGHVAAAAVRLAKLLDLPVTGLEDRPEYADALRETGADRVLCAPFETSLAQIPGSTETYFCVLTRAHAYDITCLKQILQKPAAYVGMMGSRGRSELVRRQLAEAGLDPARVARLHAPIGLAIGAKTAQEIALSILAQIVEIKSHRQLTEGFTPVRSKRMPCWQPSFPATAPCPERWAPRCSFSRMAVRRAAWAAALWNTVPGSWQKKCWQVRKLRSSWHRLPRDWKTMRKHWQPVAARWNFSYRF